MFYEGINAKVFRRSISFAIVVVVMSGSSSSEYTMSVHAVHAGAERTVCNIVVSTETPQTTTNRSQMLLPMYKLAHFKYIWAGRRDLIFTSVAQLRKKLTVVGGLEVRTWSGAGLSVLVCTWGAALEMDWWKLGGDSVYILQYYTHYSPRLHALHVLIWYTRRN